jgi:hypothetical protein
MLSEKPRDVEVVVEVNEHAKYFGSKVGCRSRTFAVPMHDVEQKCMAVCVNETSSVGAAVLAFKSEPSQFLRYFVGNYVVCPLV